MATGWPLRGRVNELDVVAGWLRGPGGQGGVIAGEAGVGKTRLAIDALGLVAPRAVVRVAATRAAATMPLGAFGPYLPGAQASIADRHDSMRVVADALVAATDDHGEPPIVFVDDAHALDDASAALVLHLALSGRAPVLVTLRSDLPAPDAIQSLWKDVLPRVDIGPLAFEDVVAIVESELGGPIDGVSARALFDSCDGNALYLRELMNGLVATGAFGVSSKLYRLHGPLSAPRRLVELITTRLADLTSRERFVLETLALTEPMGLPVVRHLGWADEWSALERQGLAEVRRSGRRSQLFVAHPTHAEVLRATISTRRRNAILRESAQGVASFGWRRRDDARRVATWRLEAGEPTSASVLLDAARDAYLASASDTAERFARVAADAGAGAEAYLVLGRSLDALGRNAEADVALARAQAEAGDDEALFAQASITRCDNLFRGLGLAEPADDLAQQALARVHDPALAAQIVAQRAMFAVLEGDVARTLEISDSLMSRDDDAAFCIAALPASMIRAVSGRTEAALKIAERALVVRHALADNAHLGDIGVYVVAREFAHLELGAIDDAVRDATTAYDVAARLRNLSGTAWLACILARAHLLTGRLELALRYGREAAIVFGDLHHPGARWGHAAVALAMAQMGDADGAEAAIADLDAEPPTTARILDCDLERARAWVCVARGETPRARSMLVATAALARSRELFTLEVAAWHDVARLGDSEIPGERVIALRDLVEGPLLHTRLAFTLARAAGDGAALDEVADRSAATGALLFAAEAATEAAVAYRRTDRMRLATVSKRNADTWVAACDRPRTPILGHGPRTAVLTRREHEIAALAAKGLSNREIGEMLFVSVRTVENHLQRAFEKLGVARRTELGAVMHEPPG